jgi:hypothetical protein
MSTPSHKINRKEPEFISGTEDTTPDLTEGVDAILSTPSKKVVKPPSTISTVSNDIDLLEGIAPVENSLNSNPPNYNVIKAKDDSTLLEGVDSILPKQDVGEFGEPEEDIVKVATTNATLKKEIPIEYENFSNQTPLERYARFNDTPWTPKVTAKNPYALLKARRVEITHVTEHDAQGNKLWVAPNETVKPNQDEILDTYLGQIDPELIEARKHYKKETGRELVHLDKNPQLEFKDGKWYADVSIDEATARIVNAYAKRGLTAAEEEGRKVYNEYVTYAQEYNQKDAEIKQFVKEHPYITAVNEGVEAGKLKYIQLIHNAEKLGDALIVSAKYGMNSEQFYKLMDEDKDEQHAINFMQSNMPEVKLDWKTMSDAEKVFYIGLANAGASPEGIKNTTALVIDTPKMIATGEGLPLLVFLENAHRGSMEATKDAFMFLPMIGVGKLLGGITESTELGIKPLLKGGGLLEETPSTIQGFTAANVQAANFSLASRAIRQATVRFGQGTVQALTDFATNPSSYLNGEKPFQVLENYEQGHGLFKIGTGERALGSFLQGGAFPVGKVEGNLTSDIVTHADDIIAGRFPSAKVEIPLDRRSESVFSESERGEWKGNWDDVVLNYLELKRSKESESYRNGDLQHDVNARSNIDHNLEILEGIIPKEWIDFVSKHEDVIREAKKGGQQRQEFRQKVAEQRQKGEITENAEKISTFDVADWAKEGHSILSDLGDSNRFVKQENVARDISASKVSLEQQQRLESKRQAGQRGSVGSFNTDESSANARISRSWYKENSPRLTRIGAFYIEAGVKDFSEFTNRLQRDLGADVYGRLSEKQIRDIYDNGAKYYETNNADPFFSGLKQNIIERFPDGNMNSKSARNLIDKLGTKNEIEWTSGLEEYLVDAEKSGKPITKQKLLEVVQNGQVKVDEIILRDYENEIETLQTKKTELYREQDDIGKQINIILKAPTNKNYQEGLRLADRKNEIQKEVSKIVYEIGLLQDKSKTRYDLKTYTAERLELEGGRNPKEVLLQVPTTTKQRNTEEWNRDFNSYLKNINAEFDDGIPITLDELRRRIDNNSNEYGPLYNHLVEDFTSKYDNRDNIYSTPHWSQENIFAHFRANERTNYDNATTKTNPSDGFHVEEFQSDLHQKAHEQYGFEMVDFLEKNGIKIELSDKHTPKKYGEAEKQIREIGGQEAESILQAKGYKQILEHPYEVFSLKTDRTIKRFKTREEAIAYAKERNLEDNSDNFQVSEALQNANRLPNISPFRDNFWKEITFKRALRTAIELGKDSLTWTTSRQQQERYHKIIATKTVRYRKLNRRLLSPSAEQYEVEYLHNNTWFSIKDNGKTLEELRPIIGNEFVNKIATDAARKPANHRGQISGNELVMKAKGYSDYDTYFPNLAKKIGKRFGAEYKVKEAETSEHNLDKKIDFDSADEAIKFFNNEDNISKSLYYTNEEGYQKLITNISQIKQQFENDGLVYAYDNSLIKRIEKVHCLEITPQMRQSLKQGFPTYGIGLEPLPKNLEKSGVRNFITPREEFNQNLKAVVDSFEPIVDAESGTVLNTGLTPSALAYELRTLYGNFNDSNVFRDLVTNVYGEGIKPHIDKLWNFVREFHENEGGWVRNPFFGKEKEIKELNQEERSNIAQATLYNTVRSVTLANINPYFRRVYEGMRDVRLMLNGYSSVLVQQLHDARALAGYKYKGLTAANPEVATAIYDLNEAGSKLLRQAAAQNNGKPPVGTKLYWDDNYLRTNYGFNDNDIASFRKVRQAQNDILNLRKKQELYHVQRGLNNLTPNTPEYQAAQNRITEIKNRYQLLNDTGYVSLQRRGNFAIYAEDPNVPVGKPDRIIYVHAKTKGEANNIVRDFKRQGLTNLDVGRVSRFRNDLNFMRKLTPGQLEDFLTASGANRQDPEIANLRKEIYSRYASFSYQIERNLTRGYKVSWKNLLDTMVNQGKTYSSSFYADIGRENALDMLDQSGIRQHRVESIDANGNSVRQNFNDKNAALRYKSSLTNHTDIQLHKPDEVTYNVTKSYIEDETTPSAKNIFNRSAAKARSITYLTQMGLDVSQFFINLTQPFILTYPQLSKVGLPNIKPELILAKAWKEVPQLLNFERRLESARRSGVGLLPKSGLPTEMREMFVRALNEDVVKAELTTAYASSQLGAGSLLEKVTNVSSVFARAGEHVTRTNAFSAFYHAGISKGLKGNSLYNFIVQNIKETHGESSYGEAPRVIRMGGEGARLFYQFGSFNQMWWENLGTAIKADKNSIFGNKLLHGATARQLGAMGVFAGIAGLPITAGIRAAIAAMYGRDEEKNIENNVRKKMENISPEYAETLKNFAMYGISGRKGVSSRLGMRIPIIDSLADINAGTVDIMDSIPAYSTISQMTNAPRDLLRRQGFRFAEDLSPRAAKNIVRAFRFASEGARERPEFGSNRGKVIVPKGRLTNWDIFLQATGVTPTNVTNEYEKKKYKELGTTVEKTKKSLRRFVRQYTPIQSEP